MENPTHLGDGVYVYFDGYGIDISVNDHRNPPVVYLEPQVLEALNTWFKHVKESQQNET